MEKTLGCFDWKKFYRNVKLFIDFLDVFGLELVAGRNFSRVGNFLIVLWVVRFGLLYHRKAYKRNRDPQGSGSFGIRNNRSFCPRIYKTDYSRQSFCLADRLFFHEQMASEFCLSSKYRIFNFYSSQRSFLFCFSYNDIFTDLQSSGSQSGEKYQK